ncbi:MAG TPA: hypothetical protein VMH61_02000 [Candidatus Acidoferrales bacterium]|nr:hypothetical protein [Candidatus Acidoferrales bacterium]
MPTAPMLHLAPPPRSGARGAGACVLALAVGALLDAWGTPLRLPPSVPLGLDVAALLCALRAVMLPGMLRARDAWRTPLDGLVLGAVALAVLLAALAGGANGTRVWFQHVAASSVFFYAVTALLRRDAGAIELVWKVLAAATVLLGLAACGGAAVGAGSFALQTAHVDAHWGGAHVLGKALLFVTLATTGRALERGAAPGWRLAVAIGVCGLVVHMLRGGFGLEAVALARLDDPLDFCVESLTLLLAFAAARQAWALRRDRPDEAPRWRALAFALVTIGGAGVLGDGSAGEGVRVLAVLATSGAIATPLAREHDRLDAPLDDQEPEALRPAA